jgi:hypothetical protein
MRYFLQVITRDLVYQYNFKHDKHGKFDELWKKTLSGKIQEQKLFYFHV